MGVPTALVLGFGPFLEVTDNPAARLARAVDGARAPGLRVVGRTMPVSYRRAVDETVAAVAALGPAAILGVGVARGRPAPMVERWGTRAFDPALPDVDGVAEAEEGPERVGTADPEGLAEALGVAISEDAGRYVCNGWIWRAVRRVERPVAFLHVPDAGFDPDRLVAGLARWVNRDRTPA